MGRPDRLLRLAWHGRRRRPGGAFGFSFVNTEGAWDVEAVGVAPDIEVFDDPTLIAQGREPMIERAVETLLAELEKRSENLRPPTPPGPDRSKF